MTDDYKNHYCTADNHVCPEVKQLLRDYPSCCRSEPQQTSGQSKPITTHINQYITWRHIINLVMSQYHSFPLIASVVLCYEVIFHPNLSVREPALQNNFSFKTSYSSLASTAHFVQNSPKCIFQLELHFRTECRAGSVEIRMTTWGQYEQKLEITEPNLYTDKKTRMKY